MKKFCKENIPGPKNFLVPILLLCLSILEASGQTAGENYIKTTTYKVETSGGISNPLPEDAAVEITYIDGLGRPKQKIAHQQSGSGGDLITNIWYDGFGRQPMECLPFEREGASLDYLEDTNNAALIDFYDKPEFGNTQNPWSQKLFEKSALKRVLKQAAPGTDWAMATTNGHEVKFSYETNHATEVHHFSVLLSGTSPSLVYNGKYPSGQLYKTVTKNENWKAADGVKNTMVDFKDKMGRTVLRRTFNIPAGAPKDAQGVISLDTYYIYDAYGNLTYVFPPKLSEQIPASGAINQTLLDNLGYEYRYDHRDRVIMKKLPGKGWEFMAYDDLDRLIATGPALSPFGDQTEGWLHTKYDIHNRVAYTLWKQGTVNESTREGLAGTPNYISEERVPGAPNNINGVLVSYTNQVAPTSGAHVLTVNYYDDYSYTGAPVSIPGTVGDGDITVHYKNATNNRPKGLPTGSWVRQLETEGQTNAIKSYSLYDKKARPVRVYSANAQGGYTHTDTKFDFIGSPQYAKTQHKRNASASVLTTKDVFTYTPQSRPLAHTHQINALPPQLISHNSYDALGRLVSKKVGGTDASGAAALQFVDYKYNVRGWLTDINNIMNLAQQGGGPQDLFAFRINYNQVDDDINGAVEPLYNGNIAETFWKTSSDNIIRKYGYAYDFQDRLLDAYYQKPTGSVPLTDSYSAHYSYDSNGNLLSLQRNGGLDGDTGAVGIDDLDYAYDGGNRLMRVQDYEFSPAGYHDLHTSPTQDDFDYDQYGNLTTNRDKGITHIGYNHLNLPIEILFSGGGKIEYLYDATGIKLKKKVTDGTTITTTEYLDGFQYTNTVLDFFPHAEGYVKAVPTGGGSPGGPSGVAYKYVFSFTDHLGNIRLKYAQDPSNNNEVSILEEDHYYPYGLKHLGYNTAHKIFKGIEGPGTGITLTPVNPFLGDSYKYKFGGKEYDDTFDINTYDFGARNYDPALARWMNLDPLAEMMRRHSPYNYAFDNPVYFIDPDGMMPGGFVGSGTGSFESYGGFDVNTTDKEGNILSTESYVNVNDANNAKGNIQATIDSENSSSVGVSLTNKRDIAGTGFAMGDSGVESLSCGCPTPPCPDAASPYPSFISPLEPSGPSSPFGNIPWVEGPDPNFGRYVDAINKTKESTDPINSKIDSLSKEINVSNIYYQGYKETIKTLRVDPFKYQNGAAGALQAAIPDAGRHARDSLKNDQKRTNLKKQKDSIIDAYLNN